MTHCDVCEKEMEPTSAILLARLAAVGDGKWFCSWGCAADYCLAQTQAEVAYA